MTGLIEVDGILRATHNSEGRLIHPTERGIRNFWRWFGDSQVVDSGMRPLVLYHGTPSVFDCFKTDRIESEGGFFFSSSAQHAHDYISDDPNGRVIKLYLRMVAKYSIDNEAWGMAHGMEPHEAQKCGHDGYVILGQLGGDTYIAFDPAQIKSASANSGEFDPSSPSITDSAASRREQVSPADTGPAP